MDQARRTPLYPVYEEYGARVIEYAGWLMPVQFSGINAEHKAVRTGAGVFDVSHMGELKVTGRGALEFLQFLLTNDCARLTPGRVMYSPVCYPGGGCVDDILLYMLAPDDYLLVVNAANTAKDLAWLLGNKQGYEVEITDVSASFAQLALQGPLAAEILRELADGDLLNLGYYRFAAEAIVAGVKCLVSRTGYTGEDGFEFYTAPENAIPLWHALMADGRAVPVGLGARDTLRLEAGMPLYGHEISPEITPIEAGLSRFVAAGKQDFIGCETLRTQLASGPPRRLIGLELDTRGVPRAECPVWLNGRQVGFVTSGTLSPWTGRPLAMALVEAGAAEPESGFAIRIRDKDQAAHRVTLPFYRRRKD